jgi:hypothetical protein
MKQASNIHAAAEGAKPAFMRYFFEDGSMLYKAEKI